MTIEVFAPAKINLALHVTGRRVDGYHLLDSIVAFASIGDRITVAEAPDLSLTIDGPMAAGLSTEDNLVLRAARLLDPSGTAAIRLTKRLPVASGIGGGSADAAAALRALARLWNVPLPGPEATAELGADVPACLMGRALRLRGIGERLTPISLPAMSVLLVNPGIALATPAVFAALTNRNNPPLPEDLPDWPDATGFCRWLAEQRNDLLPPATSLAPRIAEVLDQMRDTDCLFVGMSGSGATCFALYPPDGHSAKAARSQLERPGWWLAHGAIS
jgi:4-diphosphocytidyl-2-C-methyl-D-erythritol kinase